MATKLNLLNPTGLKIGLAAAILFATYNQLFFPQFAIEVGTPLFITNFIIQLVIVHISYIIIDRFFN